MFGGVELAFFADVAKSLASFTDFHWLVSLAVVNEYISWFIWLVGVTD